MKYSTSFLVAATASLAAAQRPANMTICDYYTTALFMNNTAENQYKLVSAVVNRAGTGNSSTTPKVNGIATPGTFNGQDINLAPYFTGAYNSTNRGGNSGVSVNFLDAGGPQALLAGMPANNTDSNQYTLFTHLYEYFGALLQCSQYGKDGYPEYAGKASQYEVHKFMDLDENQVGYFNEQVGLSAASFGVTDDDVKAVGTALNSVFNVRCAPKQQVAPNQDADYQSICIADSCPLSTNATCDSYPAVAKPANTTSMNAGNATMTSNNGSTSTRPSGSMSPTTNGSSATINAVTGGLLCIVLSAMAWVL